MKTVPDFLNTGYFQKAIELAQIINMKPEEKIEYDNSLKRLRDEYANNQAIYEEGKIEGIKEGQEMERKNTQAAIEEERKKIQATIEEERKKNQAAIEEEREKTQAAIEEGNRKAEKALLDLKNIIINLLMNGTMSVSVIAKNVKVSEDYVLKVQAELERNK